MRKRLALLALAVSSIVVIAFLVPLGILVRNQAQDRALSRAERISGSVAAGLGVAGTVAGIAVDSSDTPAEDIRDALGDDETFAAVEEWLDQVLRDRTTITPQLAQAMLDAFSNPAGTSVIFPDGTVVGADVDESPNLSQAQGGAALTAAIPGGAEVLVPVITEAGGAVVVRSFVSGAEMSQGVAVAWTMLVSLGLVLMGIAVAAADRLGRSIVKPVTELSAAARSLGEGNLGTRVEPEGPEEIAEVGEAFNFLARRLADLLEAERESVADLSHRLRTPLTALRLQAETMSNREDVAGLIEDIDRLEAAVDVMIVEARSPQRSGTLDGEVDLGAIVDHRAAFWQVLADEQGRPTSVLVEPGDHRVSVPPDELGALVDVLIGNVFTHTPEGVGYVIRVGTTQDGRSELIVEDDGPGFPSSGAIRRGESGSGSTGLGLDIVARSAERSGGGVRLGEAREGGARVEVVFGQGERQPAGTEPVTTSPL